MTVKLKNTGSYIGQIQSLDDAVAALRAIAQDMNAPQIQIPKSFYGSLQELVSDGLLDAPRLDQNGKFIPTQKGQILRHNGQVAYLYIPDFINAYKNRADRNKVHMFWCRTLTDMWNSGRDDRYWGTTATRGVFNLENGARVNLNVCENCYKKIADAKKYGTVSDFNFERFSADNDNQAKMQMGEKNSNGQYVWSCCKCHGTIQHADDVNIYDNNIWCDKCMKTENLFVLLRNAQNATDIDKWIKNGGNADIVDADYMTPLLYVAKYNPNPVVFETLVKKYGANLFAGDTQGRNALIYTAAYHNPSMSELQEFDYLKPALDMLFYLGLNVKDHYDNKYKTAIGYTKNAYVKEYLKQNVRQHKGVIV